MCEGADWGGLGAGSGEEVAKTIGKKDAGDGRMRDVFVGEEAVGFLLEVFGGAMGGVEIDGVNTATEGDGHVASHFVADEYGVAGQEVIALQEGGEEFPLGFHHAELGGKARDGKKLRQSGLRDFRAGEDGLGVGEEEEPFAAAAEFPENRDGVGIGTQPIAGKDAECVGGGKDPRTFHQGLEDGFGIAGIEGSPFVDGAIVQRSGAGEGRGVEEEAEENAFDADFGVFQIGLAVEGFAFSCLHLPKGVADGVGGEAASVDGVPVRHETPNGGLVFVRADIHEGTV